MSQKPRHFCEKEHVKPWRCVESANKQQEGARPEFAPGDSEFTGLQRRDMLKLMGASLALAGLSTACRRPEEKLLPYTTAPMGVTPGVANHFATACPHPGSAVGLVVTSHEGRPTKVEGNPSHPLSLGAAGAWEQASVLQLYDPDRSRTPSRKTATGRLPSSWQAWDEFATQQAKQFKQTKGKGLAFLVDATVSPTFRRLQHQAQQVFPQAHWYTWDLLHEHGIQQGAQAAFGSGARVMPQLDRVRVLLTIHADPLGHGPNKLRLAHDFAAGRKVKRAREAASMNRLYAVEAAYTITGANADHRLPLPAHQGFALLQQLARQLWQMQPHNPAYTQVADFFVKQPSASTPKQVIDSHIVQAMAQDLVQHQGQSLVMVGDNQPPAAHVLAYLLNSALKGSGKTFHILQQSTAQQHSAVAQSAITGNPSSQQTPLGGQHRTESLQRLTESLQAGRVDTLMIFGGNPVYTAPAALQVQQALQKAKQVIHFDLYADETAQHAHWHLPASHFLETWSDAQSHDGTASIIQPLIRPLHNSRSREQLLAQMLSISSATPQTLVRETWIGLNRPLKTEKQWRRSVHDGVVVSSQSAAHSAQVMRRAAQQLQWPKRPSRELGTDYLEVLFQPSYAVGDGRYGNIAWLQELPDPVTTMTWGNAVLVSPRLAKELKIQSQNRGRLYEADIVRVQLNDRTIDIPAFVMPGLPSYSVVLHFGYGRTHAGIVGNRVGIDVQQLLPADGSLWALGARITRLGRTQSLACTQEQFAMNGTAIQQVKALSLAARDPARAESVQTYQKQPNYVKRHDLPASLKQKEGNVLVPLQLHKSWEYKGNKWGMVIDLTSCIGCGACVTACQAENNTPVVGREQVMRGRILHWIRVDRYYTGSVDNPQAIHQPVVCMHCENAPCEPVCPVAATVHDSEGLNVMTYNRCIGTRYCANNCPYKVRRFNYLDYSNSGNVHVAAPAKRRQQLLQMQRNPDVTVRYRGVMEKCTYCTQRIQQAKHKARLQKRDPNALRDGDVTPACAQTCPTSAIVFGNLNDPNSQVSQYKQVDRNYDMLMELNTRPRTSYLGKLRNPNPKLNG
ncbi:MAG: 4Fe-4S dicluster domain-containing protein [Myxococcota bacterium]